MEVPEGEEESKQGIEKLFEEIMTGKIPKYSEGTTHTSSGILESPKQVGPKEAYSETCHN